MLKLTIKPTELWDEVKQEFVFDGKSQTLLLEHSLLSISKWEQQYHKAFLSRKDKNHEETLYYIKCMTITQHVDDDVYRRLTNQDYAEINAYIEDPSTATTIRHRGNNGSGRRDTLTSELIYYAMIAHNIPAEYQRWHLNRLLTLIDVCNVEKGGGKKRSKSDIMASNAELNARRRKEINSKG